MTFEAILQRTVGPRHRNWLSLIDNPGICCVEQLAYGQTPVFDGRDILATDIPPERIDHIFTHNAKAKAQWFILDRYYEYL